MDTQRSNNTTLLLSEHRFPLFDSNGINIMIKFCYAVILSCGLFANFSILYIQRTVKLARTRYTYLLTHLVMTDVLIGLSLIPYAFVDVHDMKITNGFVGNIFCWATLGLSLFYAGAANQVFFLCLMSIYRLLTMKWQSMARRSLRGSNLKKIIFTIWVINFLAMIPNMVSWRFVNEYGYCKRQWSKPIYGGLYTGLIFVTGIFLPISIFIISNRMIKKTLQKHNAETVIKRSAVEKATSRITYLLSILLITYVICWLPLLSYFLIGTVTNVYPHTVEGDRLRMKTIRLCVLVNALNTVLDPCFFCIQLPDYKKALKKILDLHNDIDPNVEKSNATKIIVKPREL